MSDQALRALWRQLCGSVTPEAALAWYAEAGRTGEALRVAQGPPPVLWRIEPPAPSLGPGAPARRKLLRHSWPRSAKRAVSLGDTRGEWWCVAHYLNSWYLVPATNSGEPVPVVRWASACSRRHLTDMLAYLGSTATAVRVPRLEPPPDPKPEGPRKAARRRAQAVLAAMPKVQR